MTWRKANWSDPLINADDFLGGAPVRLTFPDGSVVVGKLSVEPSRHPGYYKQNDECIMARIMTKFSGDTWMNVYTADVEVWETEAWKEDDVSKEDDKG